MSRLPVARRSDLNGARPSTATVTPTDYGLGALGKGLDDYDQSMDRIAQKEARERLREADTSFEGAFQEAAAGYDRTTPGFTQGIGQAYDQAITPAREGLSDRAIRHFDELNAQNRAQRLQQAAGIEGRALGGIARDQIEAQRLSETTGIITQFKLGTVTARKAAQQDEGRLSPDFDERYMSEFIQRRDEALKDVPDWQKPRLQAAFAEMEANERIGLLTEGFALREEQIKTTAAQGLEAIENLVFEQPESLGEGIVDATKALDGLPVAVRQQIVPTLPGRLMAKVAAGYQARGEYDELKAFMSAPETKAQMPAREFEFYTGYISKVEDSAERAMEREAVDRDLNNELMLLRTTGEGAGFDPSRFTKAYGPVEGPVMAAQALENMRRAKSDYTLTSQAHDLSTADYMARVQLLEPSDPNDPNFARDKVFAEEARAYGLKIAEQRRADPALAVANSKKTSGAWAAFAAGTAGSAQRWADTTLATQRAWGVENPQILPKKTSKDLVLGIDKAPPEKRDDAMVSAWQQAEQFGDQHKGRVWKEIQAAGLKGPDAAIIFATDGDPVALGQYTRAQASSKTLKLKDAEKTAMQSAVDREMGDFLGTFGHNIDGQSFASNLRQSAYVMAHGFKADGMSDKEAAREASRLIVGRNYVVSDKGGYRIPREVAGRLIERGAFQAGGATVKNVSGDDAVVFGAGALMRDYAYADEARLFPLGEPHERLTDEQKQRRYAKRILDRGQWINTDDGKGLMLMVTDPAGGLVAVQDVKGKPVTATWAQLLERAKKPLNSARAK